MVMLMLVIVIVVMMVLMVVIVAAAFAVVVMVMLMLVIVIVVMMVLVIVAAAFAVVMVVMLVLMLVIVVVIIVMVVLMIVIVAAAFAVMMVVMLVLVVVIIVTVMVVRVAVAEQTLGAFDHLEQLIGGQLVPRGRDDAGVRVVAAQQLYTFFDAILAGGLRAAEDDGFGIFDLVNEEFAEVARIHAAFANVRHGGATLERQRVILHQLRNDLANVGELAHAGGLDDDAVGIIFFDQFSQRPVEIAHQRAADAAGVQLGDLDAAVLHEAAVHAHFAVFVFQQYHFFIFQRAAQQLFDERGFARAEETGNNVDFCHA